MVIFLVSEFPSRFMIPKLHKKVHFFIFLSLLKQLTYMHPKGLVLCFQKKVIVYYDMIYCFGDIKVWSRTILLNFYWVNIFFGFFVFDIFIFIDILISISWAVAHTPINHIICWKNVMRTLRYNMQIFLSVLVFLLKSEKNCKKCTFLNNLRVITQEGDMKIRQMTSFFSSTFPTVTHLFLYLKIVTIHFHVALLWPILVCEIPQFWAKATDLNSPSYFYRK